MSFDGGYFGHDSSASSQPQSTDGTETRIDRSVRTVTIHQLSKARTVSPTDETLELDGRPIKHVRFVARILEKSKRYATNQVFRLEDGTGIVSAKYFIRSDLGAGGEGGNGEMDDFDDFDNDDSNKVKPPQIEFEVGQYYSVFCKVSRTDSTNSYIALHLQPVKDHNQVAYSQLKAIQEYIKVTDQQPRGTNASAGNNKGSDSLFVSDPQDKLGGAGTLASRVKLLLRNQSGAEGVHENVIASRLGEDKDAVAAVLQQLLELGEVYETDSRHFAAE